MTRLADVRLLPDPLLRAAITAGPGWRSLGYRIRERAERECPRGRDPETGKPHQGGHLAESIFARFAFGADPRIEIGSAATVGEPGWSLFDIVESGIPGGVDIYPKNAQALRFIPKGGTVVFAAHVTQGATHANKFVERAMQRVVHEVA